MADETADSAPEQSEVRGDPAEDAATLPPNQGATGTRPLGESPLSVASDGDMFAERPELFVGAAFAGGVALALILRRFAP